MILCNSDEAEPKERQYLRLLEEQRVRGILITPVHGRAPSSRGIREPRSPGLPGRPAHRTPLTWCTSPQETPSASWCLRIASASGPSSRQ